MATFSHSRVSTYKNCPRKYKLKYVDGLDEQRSNTDALDLGTLVHDGLEAALSAKDQAPLEAALASVDSCDIGYILQIEKAKTCLRAYIPMLGIGTSQLRPLQFGGKPLLEHQFDIPLLGGVDFTGYIDAVCSNDKGETVLIDWKTRGRFYSHDVIQLDAQLHLYAHALYVATGIVADKAYQVQLRTPGPASPKLKSDGTLDMRMGKTTKAAFEDGLAELEFKGGLGQLRRKFEPMAHWIDLAPVEVHPTRYADDLCNWVRAIQNDTTFPPVCNAFTCKLCAFKDQCLTG